MTKLQKSRHRYFLRNRKRFRKWCRESYQRHKVKRQKENRDKLRMAYQLVIARLKQKPCMDCGGWFEPCQMDFDHRNPETKVTIIGHMRACSVARIWKESQKCDLVCANCHRLRTFKRIHHGS